MKLIQGKEFSQGSIYKALVSENPEPYREPDPLEYQPKRRRSTRETYISLKEPKETQVPQGLCIPKGVKSSIRRQRTALLNIQFNNVSTQMQQHPEKENQKAFVI